MSELNDYHETIGLEHPRAMRLLNAGRRMRPLRLTLPSPMRNPAEVSAPKLIAGLLAGTVDRQRGPASGKPAELHPATKDCGQSTPEAVDPSDILDRLEEELWW